MGVFDRPIRKTSSGNCDAVACFTFHVRISILLTHLRLFTTARPTLPKKVPSYNVFVTIIYHGMTWILTRPIHVVDCDGEFN